MADNKLPSGIDRVVGQRIRWRRKELKLTQEKLGELLGLTFQQVQKYEKGVNRVSAGRLFEMSTAMGVPITYFFDGAETFLDHQALQVAEDGEAIHAPVMTGEILDLIAAAKADFQPDFALIPKQVRRRERARLRRRHFQLGQQGVDQILLARRQRASAGPAERAKGPGFHGRGVFGHRGV